MNIDSWFLLALASAVFSAGAALSQKEVLFRIDALPFSFLLFLFVAFFSLPAVLYFDITGISVTNLGVLYIRSALGALSFLFVMLSIKNMEISRALPLLALTPGFVALAAFLFLNDSLTILQIVGMLLLITGTYILEIKNRNDLLEPFKVFYKSRSHLYVLSALLLFTITAITDRALLSKYKFPAVSYFFFQQIFYMVTFTLIILFAKKGAKNLSLLRDIKVLKWLVLIAILTIAYRFSEILAIKIAPVALVLSVKRLSIFIAVIVGGKIFKENNLIKKIIAAGIILAGSFLIML